MKNCFYFLLIAAMFALCLSACAGQAPEVTLTPSATLFPSATLPPTMTPTVTYTPAPVQTLSSVYGETQQIDLYSIDRYGIRLALWYYPPAPGAEKSLAVLLGHESGGTHWNWNSIAVVLAEKGYPVFSLEFRGHGASDGILNYPSVGVDVQTAVNYINAVGYQEVVCIGASMGGSGCLAAANNVSLSGLGMFSSPMNIPGTALVTWADLEAMNFPKLFIIAEEDLVIDQLASFVTDFIEMAERAPEPKQLYVYPGTLHGTSLLWGDDGEEIQQILFDFIDGIAAGE